MKVVNEKGKLFGIINLVDLLVLLFVLAVALGVLWKIFGAQITGALDDLNLRNQEAQFVRYTVRIIGNDRVYYDEAVKIGFPQQLAVNDGPVENCYLVGMELEPAYIITTDAEGVTKRMPYDSRYDIICIIEGTVPPGDFITFGSQEVRIGRSHVVKTQFFEITGVIQTLETDIAAFAPDMAKTEG